MKRRRRSQPVLADAGQGVERVLDSGVPQPKVEGCAPKRNRVTVRPTIWADGDHVLVCRRANHLQHGMQAYTASTRTAVRLGITANFSGHGILTISDGNVRLLRANAPLAFDGADNRFSAAELLQGVDLWAEGVAPSPGVAPHQQTTLTLTLGGAGQHEELEENPATRALIAVQLELRVDDGAGHALTTPQRVFEGRHLQVPAPGHSHRRARVVVAAPNPFVPGVLRLRRGSAELLMYDVQAPAHGQVELGATHDVDAVAARDADQAVWLEADAVGDARALELFLDFTPQGGALLSDGDRAVFTGIEVCIVAADDTPGFGLFDGAFHADDVMNQQAEDLSFVGSDSGAFRLAVEDRLAAGRDHVVVRWTTARADGGVLDDPADNQIVAPPHAPDGRFISRRVMLVSNAVDKAQATHSGLGLGLPDGGAVQAAGARNHRLRLGAVDGTVWVEYRAGHGVFTSALPVFPIARRRRLPVYAFLVRAVDDDGTDVDVTMWESLRVVRETYAPLGILAEFPASPVVRGNPVTRQQGGMHIKVVNPPSAEDYGAWDGTAVQLGNLGAVAMAYRLDVNGEGMPNQLLTVDQRNNTICLFFVQGLAAIEVDGGSMIPGGLSFFGLGNHAREGTVVVNPTVGPLAAAHEIGHILTGKPAEQNTGHYRASGQEPRQATAQNLMRRTFLGANVVNGPKRLWFEADADGCRQIVAIRASRFLRPW